MCFTRSDLSTEFVFVSSLTMFLPICDLYNKTLEILLWFTAPLDLQSFSAIKACLAKETGKPEPYSEAISG